MLKFINDTIFNSLETALKENNYRNAFRAVHTLKGLSYNLGFTTLGKSSDILTELLRTENLYNKEKILLAFKKVKTDYNITISALEKYKNS